MEFLKKVNECGYRLFLTEDGSLCYISPEDDEEKIKKVSNISNFEIMLSNATQCHIKFIKNQSDIDKFNKQQAQLMPPQPMPIYPQQPIQLQMPRANFICLMDLPIISEYEKFYPYNSARYLRCFNCANKWFKNLFVPTKYLNREYLYDDNSNENVEYIQEPIQQPMQQMQQQMMTCPIQQPIQQGYGYISQVVSQTIAQAHTLNPYLNCPSCIKDYISHLANNQNEYINLIICYLQFIILPL